MNKEKIKNKVENLRQNVIDGIANSSLTTFFIKWLVTHWVTVLFCFIAVSGYLYGVYQKERAIKALVQVEVSELNKQLEELKNEKELLDKKLKEYEDQKLKDKNDLEKVKDSAGKLSAEQKKKLVDEYISKLKKRRGI